MPVQGAGRHSCQASRQTTVSSHLNAHAPGAGPNPLVGALPTPGSAVVPPVSDLMPVTRTDGISCPRRRENRERKQTGADSLGDCSHRGAPQGRPALGRRRTGWRQACAGHAVGKA